MNLITLSTLIVAVAAMVSAVYSIWRNGRHHRDNLTKFKTEIQAEVKTTTDTLKHSEYGLMAINAKVGSFQVNCADTSGRLEERVIALEAVNGKKKTTRRRTKSST